jgi:hypothetical protein
MDEALVRTHVNRAAGNRQAIAAPVDLAAPKLFTIAGPMGRYPSIAADEKRVAGHDEGISEFAGTLPDMAFLEVAPESALGDTRLV